jgi:hypothetical protein
VLREAAAKMDAFAEAPDREQKKTATVNPLFSAVVRA